MNKENKIPSIELLLDYLDGMLDSENTKRIRKQIEASEELKTIVNGIIHMRDSEGHTDDQIIEYVEKLKGDFVSSKLNLNKKKSESFGWWKVAASVTLLIGAWYLVQLFFFKETANEFVDNQLSQVYEAPQLFRDSETEWALIHEYYESRNFDSAIAKLLEIEKTDSEDVTALFYLGMCYLYSDQANLSIDYFQKVAKGSSRLNERATWFLALAYLEIDNKSEAFAVLENIIQSKGYKYQEAQELVDLLD